MEPEVWSTTCRNTAADRPGRSGLIAVMRSPIHGQSHSGTTRGHTLAAPRLYDILGDVFFFGRRRPTFQTLIAAAGVQPGQRAKVEYPFDLSAVRQRQFDHLDFFFKGRDLRKSRTGEQDGDSSRLHGPGELAQLPHQDWVG